MKLHTRRRIFYVFLLLFFVIGAVVVLYAEGWRLNPTTLEAEKVGGIYVRSFPDDAQITLDGKPIQNQTAFLSNGTFISGLFPKTYVLQLKESGYDGWTEDPEVTPSLVAEMKYAVLVPQTATNVATSSNNSNVENFFEIGGNIITENTSNTITWQGIGINAYLGKGKIISHSTNLKTTIIRSTNPQTGLTHYFLYDFTNATSSDLSALLQASGISYSPTLNIFIDPYDDTSIIVQTPEKIVSIDSENHAVTVIETAPTGYVIGSPMAISPSVMAWTRISSTENTSQVMIYDKFSGDMIDSSLVVPGKIKQLAWIKNGQLGILEGNTSLYLYNVSGEQLTKLADDVKQYYATPDGTAIAALEYHSLEVFSFTTSNYYRFNLPQATDVQGLIWYKDETHLFVQYPDHVSFLDLADTNIKNFTTISAGTDAMYNPQENSLYLIDQAGKLLRFDFPQ